MTPVLNDGSKHRVRFSFSLTSRETVEISSRKIRNAGRKEQQTYRHLWEILESVEASLGLAVYVVSIDPACEWTSPFLVGSSSVDKAVLVSVWWWLIVVAARNQRLWLPVQWKPGWQDSSPSGCAIPV